MRKLEEERLLRKSMLEAEWMIKKNKKVNKQKG
jgi:flagella basal body P-ring formation protein FlgA